MVLKEMLTAEDISKILNHFNLNDNTVSILGCPEHLYKTLLDDKYNIKSYICYNNYHWFTIVFLRERHVVITMDSLGSKLNCEYKKKILEFDKKIKFFYFCNPVQTDGISCGLFAIVFIFLFFHMYNRNPNNVLETLKHLKKKHVLYLFNKIEKKYFK